MFNLISEAVGGMTTLRDGQRTFNQLWGYEAVVKKKKSLHEREKKVYMREKKKST